MRWICITRATPATIAIIASFGIATADTPTQSPKSAAPAGPAAARAESSASSLHQPAAAPPKSNGPPTLLSLFRDLAYRYTGGGYHDKLIRYRLFVPEISSPSQKFPLIIWLHGDGEGGTDNALQLRYLDTLMFQPPFERSRYPYFLLAVQCPPDNRLWATRSDKADDMINVVIAILDKTSRELPVDTSRILVAGISSGGTGCWQLAASFPDRFAAAAPMSSAFDDPTQADRLSCVPVWAFHSAGDRVTSGDVDRKMVAAVNVTGGQAYLTVTDTPEHNCWTAAFHEYDLLDWLLYQRRGEVSDYPPGRITLKRHWHDFSTRVTAIVATMNPSKWQPWQYAMQFGIPALLVLACLSAIKQRRKASHVEKQTPIKEPIA